MRLGHAMSAFTVHQKIKKIYKRKWSQCDTEIYQGNIILLAGSKNIVMGSKG